MNFANRTPQAVAIIKDIRPRRNIFTDVPVRNTSACVEHPTVSPINMVTTSIIGPLAVSARRFVTPLSLRRLPKKSIPSKGIPEGTIRAVSTKPTIGKMIFSRCFTSLGAFILIRRSFWVVRSSIIGRWITGTNAIYEYADTAIAPISCGASLDERKIAVGPSAPPMIPIAPDSAGVNPKCIAKI